ncbi:histidine phosphatase family protein [Geminocystis sp. GBBB08]|uniref:histidine phosphatase family protein n=1 Tax=Geminocystis sp. GBBB08 TaxID=2604140 RepID=UPI0027E39724|nr:histidine phosphatase family protein [Geminocystis sp. GBBB08]MBL1209731.1 histidine phosphatase family protein [Geminocystis sp. GBBB08]
MSSRLWIVRHGNRFDFVYPAWFNTALRRYDPPLSFDGKIQVQELALKLKNEPINHVIASPFLRTIQTAHILAEKLNLNIKLEAGLGEWHNPDWMTQTPVIHPREELEGIYYRIDWNYQSQIIPKYPETEAMVLKRMKKIAQLLITQFEGNLLLVGHSISVIGITKGLLGHDVKVDTSLCSVTKLIL